MTCEKRYLGRQWHGVVERGERLDHHHWPRPRLSICTERSSPKKSKSKKEEEDHRRTLGSSAFRTASASASPPRLPAPTLVTGKDSHGRERQPRRRPANGRPRFTTDIPPPMWRRCNRIDACVCNGRGALIVLCSCLWLENFFVE
jgi:hypothetical protein